MLAVTALHGTPAASVLIDRAAPAPSSRPSGRADIMWTGPGAASHWASGRVNH